MTSDLNLLLPNKENEKLENDIINNTKDLQESQNKISEMNILLTELEN